MPNNIEYVKFMCPVGDIFEYVIDYRRGKKYFIGFDAVNYDRVVRSSVEADSDDDS